MPFTFLFISGVEQFNFLFTVSTQAMFWLLITFQISWHQEENDMNIAHEHSILVKVLKYTFYWHSDAYISHDLELEIQVNSDYPDRY